MNLDKEIQRLSDIWYRYVSLDHHKDRDCHFTVNKTWSYGNAPTYYAVHWGYVAEDFSSQKRDTYEEAAWDIVFLLRREIQEHIKFCKRNEKEIVGDYWTDWDVENNKKCLEILMEWKND